MGFAKQFSGTLDAELIEAIAAREAILPAELLEIPSFLIEGNSRIVIDLPLNKEEGFSCIGLVIDDIRIAMVVSYVANINWCPKESNKVPHKLASFAKSGVNTHSL